MRIKIIACRVLSRELSELSATSGNIIDITFIKQGYHNEPEKLRQVLQEIVDKIDNGTDPFSYCSDEGDAPDFDAIVLGYGLCSNGVVGVKSKKYPLIIPRAHDCITLFLGSKERYRTLFDEYAGKAYWYTAGWVENTPMPSKKRMEELLSKYTEKYGEDNAEFLLNTENGWFRDYGYAVYIKPNKHNYPDYREFTREAAEHFGWEYKEADGEMSLMDKMVSGDFVSEHFLVLSPGQSAEPSFDSDIIKAAHEKFG